MKIGDSPDSQFYTAQAKCDHRELIEKEFAEVTSPQRFTEGKEAGRTPKVVGKFADNQ